MTPEPTPSQELREKIDKLLDFFTEPNQGEKYLKDLANDLEQLFTQHELSRKQEWVESLIKKLPLSNCVRHHSDDFSKDCTCDLINRDQITKTIKEQSKE